MSLRPIDLQTLFMRQTELSREKAALHDGMVQKKAVEEAESVEEAKANEEKVIRTEELPEGPEAVKDAKDQQNPQGEKRPAARKAKSESELPDEDNKKPENEVVKDPMLGRIIDFNA